MNTFEHTQQGVKDYLERLGVFFNGELLLGERKKEWGKSEYHRRFSENKIAVLEVDIDQTHPDTNVVKFWPYLESNPKIQVLLIHAFTLVNDKNEASRSFKGSRRRLCDWYGRRIERELPGRFVYKSIVVDDLHDTKQLSALQELISSFVQQAHTSWLVPY